MPGNEEEKKVIGVPQILMEIRDLLKEMAVKPAPPPIVPPTPAIPTTVEESLRAMLDIMKKTQEPATDYFVIDGSVTKDNPVRMVVREVLGRPATRGYITSDDGTIYVQINKGGKITLNAGDTLPLDGFDVRLVDITTSSTSSLRFRGVVW